MQPTRWTLPYWTWLRLARVAWTLLTAPWLAPRLLFAMLKWVMRAIWWAALLGHLLYNVPRRPRGHHDLDQEELWTPREGPPLTQVSYTEGRPGPHLEERPGLRRRSREIKDQSQLPHSGRTGSQGPGPRPPHMDLETTRQGGPGMVRTSSTATPQAAPLQLPRPRDETAGNLDRTLNFEIQDMGHPSSTSPWASSALPVAATRACVQGPPWGSTASDAATSAWATTSAMVDILSL